MKDVQGIELKAGHRVAFRFSSTLLLGTILEIKIRKSYGESYESARIELESPRERQKWAWDYTKGVDASTTIVERFREVRDSKSIVVCPKI
jgi:hypothetical protein